MDHLIFLKKSDDWDKLQKVIHNSVVQLFAQVAEFNWLEPYKVRREYERRGSGFFINDEGYLITNAHIVNEAKTMWLQIPSFGRKPLFADVVGFCPERDLALLRLKEKDREFIQSQIGTIPWLSLGDSDTVERTSKVMVLGYPLGQYRMKVATGIVSGRESAAGRIFLQITAPVNPGNSGGPLLDDNGTVIGVAIAAASHAQNVGYAIPINELKLILDDLYTTPFVRRTYLGASFNYSSDEQASFFGNPLPAGFYVNKVFKNSLFETAGIQAGDMIYEFNGYRIDTYGDAQVPWSGDKISIFDLVSRLKIGDEASLVIYRNGKRNEIHFAFTLTDPYPIRWIYPEYEKVEYELFGGMVIMQFEENHLPPLIKLMPYLVKYNKMENKVDPILVISHIMPGSYAHQLRNLMPGFTISEINGTAVNTLAQLRDALSTSLQTGFVTLKTTDDVFVVFSLKKILEQEPQLAKGFVYQISPTIQALMRK
jgi:serine protease Do